MADKNHSTAKEVDIDPVEVNLKRAAAAEGNHPPDIKKAKGSETTCSNVTPTAINTASSTSETDKGVLTILSANLSSPYPTTSTAYVQIKTEDMTSYFKSLHDSIVNVMYPIDSSPISTGLISQNDFVLVCRYLTKARIDHVFSSISGKRPDNRIAIPTGFQLPKALADIINRIGKCIGQRGALQYVPMPEDNPVDQSHELSTRVSHAMLGQFQNLVTAASVRGFIRTGFISVGVKGTAWWVMIARQSKNTSNIASDDENARACAVFPEWTLEDAMLCVIVQRLNNGLEPGYDSVLKWSTDDVFGIPIARSAFNVRA